MTRAVPPMDACLRPATFWRGWVGLAMIAAGMGAAGIARLAPPPPESRLSFLPPKGPVGIRVVLEGRGLERTRSVRFGARDALFTVVSGERVETHVPDGAVTAPITLTLEGGAVLTSGAEFRVSKEVPIPPVISGFKPGSGPGGTEVSVAGTGFEAVEQVWVGGRVAEFTTLNDAALVLYVPPDHPLSGPVVLSSPFGTTASSEPFQVTADSGLAPSK